MPKTEWLALQPGDIVDLVAPGFPVAPERVAQSVEFLKSWGLEARVPRDLQGRDLLCANSDEKRLRVLREALSAEDSRAVWCLRGGYGCLRLIPELSRVKRPKVAPKLFVGLSDITVLHTHLTQNWAWPSVHGPHMDRLSRPGAAGPKHIEEMRKFAFGEISSVTFAGLRALNAPARRDGEIRASVTGGNLAILQSLIGTKGDWDPSGQIVFLEDIGERGYRLDRMLEHLRQAGKFSKVRAMVLGQFTEGDEPEGAKVRSLVKPVLKRFAESVSFPVYWGLPSGHDFIQRPVPFGTPSRLKLGPTATLTCATGVSSSRK